MKIQQIITILIALLIVVLIIGAGVFLWMFLHPAPIAQTNNTGTGSQTPIGGTNPTQVVPSNTSNQTPTADPVKEFDVFVSTMGAKRLALAPVSTTTGTFGDIYKLYVGDIALSKKIQPGAVMFTIHAGSIDLNGDGVGEVVVYDDMPGLCGSGGCTIDVYKKKGSGWENILTTLGYEGVAVSNTKALGFSNLLFTVRGESASETTIQQYVWGGAAYGPDKAVGVWDGSAYRASF
jgi:hypothetical protein